MTAKIPEDNTKSRILLSIRPEYADKIIRGTKKYEYRKTIPKENISSLIIYETAPVKLVAAEVEVVKILALPPGKLWETTKEYSGVKKEFFDGYFKGRKTAYAYVLGKTEVFDPPRALSDYGIKSAPQSFTYI